MSTDETANRCIELNETIQILVKETINSIDADVEQIKNETVAVDKDKVVGASYVNPKANYLRKQYFRTHDNDCPPVNADTKERIRLKETNIADDLNSTLHKLTQAETMKLLFAIVDCYRTTLQEKLREKIDNLTETLAQVNKGFSERRGIYSELQSAEKELSKSRKIISSAVPREITNFITSLSNVIPDSAQWTNKFEEMAKCKVDDTKSSCISLPEWISILSKAHTVLTDNDWNHISVHVLKSVKSATFCRLYWFHRLRPGLVHGVWSSKELESLGAAVTMFGPCGHWQRIADHLNCGRSAFSCFKAWHKYLNPDHPSKIVWTSEEDKSLDVIVDDEVKHECKAISLIDWGVVSARLQTRSAIACQRRYEELHNTFRSEPFTTEEDLTLLKSIQCLGTGGGTFGWGTGGENPTCVGTWSVIAAQLPTQRRTARECELRHNELCEKFQPWTYAELRRLFKFATHIKETTNNDSGPLITVNILPYFPGRPMSALLTKMQDCKLLASILKRLRRFPHHPGVQFDEFFSSAEMEPIRPHLFSPPSVLCEWVGQLQRIGIRNPEGYAFSRLLAWKPREPYQVPEGQKPNYKLEAFHEFSQLLMDLEENILLPSSSEISQLQNEPLAGGNQPSPSSRSNQLHENKGLHIVRVARLINSYQMRPVVFSLLSKEIERRMHLAVPDLPSFDGERGEGKRKIKTLSRYSANKDLKAGEKLLKDHEFFTKIFERVLSYNRRASNAYYGYNPRALDGMAPELAGDMLFYAQEELVSGVQSREPQEAKSYTKSVPLAKLQRVIRIRQLLLKSRIPTIKSGSLKTPWTMPFVECGRTDQQQEQIKPPLLAHIPDSLRAKLLDPTFFPTWVTERATSLVAEFLGVGQDSAIQIMSPNQSTILVFKSLLLKLPEFQRLAGGIVMRILRYRTDCNYFGHSQTNSSSTDFQNTKIDELIQERPDIAAMLSSAKHRTFILRCFSLFLWPCLLANMPARGIVDRSIAFLNEQSQKLDEFLDDEEEEEVESKKLSSKRRETRITENAEVFSSKPHFRSEKTWNHPNFPNAWTQFTVNFNDTMSVVCELPSNVEDLIKCGFVPDNLDT
ncbi:unnamed protein product [Hymenolepis diminuta]|uniref:snRNA-activating protein complex subunit 4 n=1 Tax=Hymenolepis diminuta TaxID=6216 RepID=A0A0R3SPN5_HYMDI|nr:unnamed protein product [Hymenolepis diminuta]VUZ48949.1 unnamed protein product [Hymenolepis diminuta]